ncbi:hypothetical protein AB0L88_21310 [Saccharopolyspora shandongensis]|uniref:hypothetical protein n=1 Tax=Saccharopolyspora shandongensis TaxID=418495 RepID=UPI003443E59B
MASTAVGATSAFSRLHTEVDDPRELAARFDIDRLRPLERGRRLLPDRRQGHAQRGGRDLPSHGGKGHRDSVEETSVRALAKLQQGLSSRRRVNDLGAVTVPLTLANAITGRKRLPNRL